MCSGPVGLALTNSRLMFSPASASLAPYCSPAATTWSATTPCAPASTRMLRKPGPAISTPAIPSRSPSRAWTSVASSRGLSPAFLPSWSATLVA